MAFVFKLPTRATAGAVLLVLVLGLVATHKYLLGPDAMTLKSCFHEKSNAGPHDSWLTDEAERVTTGPPKTLATTATTATTETAQATFPWLAQRKQWLGSTEACRFPDWRQKSDRIFSLPCKRPLRVLDWEVPRNLPEWKESSGTARVPDFDVPFVEAAKAFMKVSLPYGVAPNNTHFFPSETWVSDCGGLFLRTKRRNALPLVDLVSLDFPYSLQGYDTALTPYVLPPPATHNRSHVLRFDKGESAEYYWRITDRSFLIQFNLTVGDTRGFMDLYSPNQWIGTSSYVASLQNRSAPVLRATTTLIASFISNCAASNFRLDYLRELMRVLPVHSYGKCLHNQNVDDATLKKQGVLRDAAFNWDVKQAVLGTYTFGIAFENSNCYDYVTEKIFNVLASGAIPVYMGAPNIEQFVPPGSYIDTRWFSGPVELAAYLQTVASDRDALRSYHAWRLGKAEDWYWIKDSRRPLDICKFYEDQVQVSCDRHTGPFVKLFSRENAKGSVQGGETEPLTSYDEVAFDATFRKKDLGPGLNWRPCARFLCSKRPECSQNASFLASPTFVSDKVPCCVHVLRDLLVRWTQFTIRVGLRSGLVYGSLLGAMRDHKIIPWTADVDVGLAQSEYKELLQNRAWRRELFDAGLALFSDEDHTARLCATEKFDGGLLRRWLMPPEAVVSFPSHLPYMDIYSIHVEKDADSGHVKVGPCAMPSSLALPFAQGLGLNGLQIPRLWAEPACLDAGGVVLGDYCLPAPPNATLFLRFVYGPTWRDPPADKARHGSHVCGKNDPLFTVKKSTG